MTTMPQSRGGPPRGGPGIARVAGAARRQRGWLTLAALLVVSGCGFATWWQVRRAMGGNLLSDFYSAMWPMYGCYVIYLWSRLLRDHTSPAGEDRGPQPESVARPDERDEELRAYNRYLAAKRADAQRRGR